MLSNTVSVIDEIANRIIANLTVGWNPIGITVNPTTNKIYATDYSSNSLSVLDASRSKVIDTIPVGRNPVGIAVYRKGTQCHADAGRGYEFSSWSKIAFGSSNPLDLRVSQYGWTLIANYKPTLTFEQYLAIILGPISVVSRIVGWCIRNRQRRHLNKYMAIIETAFEELSDNNNIKDCLLHLQLVRKEITNLFGKGKVGDGYILDRKISEYIERVKTDKM